MRARWAGEPRWVRVGAFLLVTVLLWGCAQHVADLVVGGGSAYAGFPGWMAGYWTALTVLDPMAAVFVARRHRLAWSAPVILLSDGLVNLWAGRLAGTAGPLALAPVGIVLLGVAATLLTPRVTRVGSAA